MLLRRLLDRENRQRGATTIEYAMVGVMVVAVASTAIGHVTDSVTVELADRGDRIGNPEDAVVIEDPGGSTGGSVGDEFDPGDGAPVEVALTDLSNRRSTALDPKWQASVDISVVQVLSSDPATGVTIHGSWDIVSSKGTKSQTVSCLTNTNGECTMTIDGLQLGGSKPDTEAWFSVSSLEVDPDTYTWNGSADTTEYGSPPTVLICRPGTSVSGPPGSETCT